MGELPLCEREDQRREGKEWLVLNGLASISLFMSSAGRPDIIQWITFLQFWKPSLCVLRTWPSTCICACVAAKQMAFRIHFLDMLHVLFQNTSEYIQEGLKLNHIIIIDEQCWRYVSSIGCYRKFRSHVRRWYWTAKTQHLVHSGWW